MTSTMEFAPQTSSHSNTEDANTVRSNTARTPEVTVVTKGWHADPLDQHDLRFHDGRIWTEHVTHFGPVPCQSCNPFAV